MKRTSLAAMFAIAVVLGAGSQANAVALVNPGFDDQDASAGDIPGAAGWGSFNDSFTTAAITPHSSPNTLKVFGPFFDGGGAGVFQGGFAASEGQLWEASAWARIDSSDLMTDSNFAVVKLEFLDAGNMVIGFSESPQITTASLAADTWQQFSTQSIAPAGTTSAQIVLVHVQLDPISGGSIFFDDATLALVPEPASVVFVVTGLLCVLGVTRRQRT